ncbi:MAG: hypothetical protein QW083_04075 [Methanomassiliicoccales archaeon]
MARKKKKEVVEEEYEFIPPEFDEKAFLENDIRSTKTLLLTTLFAVLCGIIAFLLGEFNVLLGLVVLFAGIFLLRYLPILIKIKPEELDKKTLLGNGVLFFFLFLGIWILLMNPPFSDHTSPHVTEVAIWYQDGPDWVRKQPTDFSFSGIPRNAVINITATIVDNGGLKSVKLEFSGQPAENMSLASGNIYQLEKDLSKFTGSGPFVFHIVAIDESDNQLVSNSYNIYVIG